MKIKIIALLFLLFIIFIIIGADHGSLASLLRGIYNFPGGDKLGHFVLYGILALLLALAFPRPLWPERISVPLVIIALLVFATLEECSQQLFSTRTFDLIDLTCTYLGILAGTWLAAREKIVSLIRR